MSDSKSLRVLHFADAHIDIANYGRHDPDTALPIRVMDFLRALDQIIDAAIDEKVDLVLFAGDAYKDRNPQPTFQREWGKRMMRLSEASIPTLLLVGNHDVAPASGRAHTLQEFKTLNVPHIYVADRIERWGPDRLGVPIQVITVPWVSRSQLMTREETTGMTTGEVYEEIENLVTKAIVNGIESADPDVPLVLMAHASVNGAKYGSERMVMLGHELVLGGGVVSDRRLDYVALGHIHQYQHLEAAGSHPPIVYPGSIERIDFGEERESKGFITAEIAKGSTDASFHKLKTRPMRTFPIQIDDSERFMETVMDALPSAESVADAICRVQLTYPRDWEDLVDEKQIAERFSDAFSLQIQKHRQQTKRARLGDALSDQQLSPLELLDHYWVSKEFGSDERDVLRHLAQEIIHEANQADE